MAFTPLVLINGIWTDQISIADRGLSYGDGVFETVKCLQGQLCLWPLHHSRLLAGLQRLGIAFDAQLARRVSADLQLLSQRIANADGVVKLIITRGVGGRGYQAPSPAKPSVIITFSPAPHYPPSYTDEGIKLFLCETRLGVNPQLAGIKHLNRLEQVMARREWRAPYAEGVVRDINGVIVEGTMSNLFVERDGELLTPSLNEAGVAGTVRRWVIDFCVHEGIVVREARLVLNDLLQADGLFMTNSLIGIWPVQQFCERRYPVSSLSQRLRVALERAERVSEQVL